MRTFRFVCSFSVSMFAILAIVLVTAQSSAVRANQSTDAPNATLEPRASTGVVGMQAVPGKQAVKFAKAVIYGPGGDGTDSVAIADLRGDGHSDLVVANASNWVGVLLGNGDGTFQTAIGYASGGYEADAVAIADVNGDGHADIVVANQCSTSTDCSSGGIVSVLLGNGDGTFQPAVGYNSGGMYATSVAIKDLNGDGHPDLVVANSVEVGVLLGNGNGTFQTAVAYSSGGYTASSVVIGDVNGDGRPDLVVGNACPLSGSCNNGVVSVLVGNGNGTFQAPVTYDSGGYIATSVAIADVNGDGYPDLIAANFSDYSVSKNGVVSVLLGNGDGTFQAAVSYSSGGYEAESVAVADVNGDGHMDLAVANCAQKDTICLNGIGVVGVLLGNGDGTFQAPVKFSSGDYESFSVAIGDLNGDGRPDLAVANYNLGSVSVLLNATLYATATALTSSPNPSVINQSVTFTATTTSNPPISDGETVTFYNGATKIGTATTTNGVATLATSFSKAKTYTIKASYPGDAFHKASSGTVKQVVNP